MIADIISGAIGGTSDILFGIYDRAEDKNRYDQDRTTALEESARARQQVTHQADLNRKFADEQAGKAREFNANEARLAREWQEKMSSTAMQRGMKDMVSAGLNPALMYTRGSSAGAYSGGAVASSSSPNSSGGSTGGTAKYGSGKSFANPKARALDMLGIITSAHQLDMLKDEIKTKKMLNAQRRANAKALIENEAGMNRWTSPNRVKNFVDNLKGDDTKYVDSFTKQDWKSMMDRYRSHWKKSNNSRIAPPELQSMDAFKKYYYKEWSKK